jgi:hypothetical protein
MTGLSRRGQQTGIFSFFTGIFPATHRFSRGPDTGTAYFWRMVIWIIISFIILLFLWVLFAPVILFVNTDTEQYSLRIPGVFKLALIGDEELPRLRLRILFIPFRIDPLKVAGRRTDKTYGLIKSGKMNLACKMRSFSELIKSFRIKILYADIDTGDIVLNSFMVPVLMAIRTRKYQLYVNYEERYSLKLDLRNRLANLLWIGIKYQYRSIVKL